MFAANGQTDAGNTRGLRHPGPMMGNRVLFDGTIIRVACGRVPLVLTVRDSRTLTCCMSRFYERSMTPV
jgi:hypothetical protein